MYYRADDCIGNDCVWHNYVGHKYIGKKKSRSAWTQSQGCDDAEQDGASPVAHVVWNMCVDTHVHTHVYAHIYAHTCAHAYTLAAICADMW